MKKTDIDMGIYITDKGNILILWENRNKTGNMANKKGCIFNGFFMPAAACVSLDINFFCYF